MYIQRSRIKSGIFLEWSCLFLNVLEPPCGDFNILSRMLLRTLGSKMQDSGLLASLLKTYYFPYVVMYNNLRKYLYFLPSIYWLPFCPSWLPSVHHDWLLFPVLELFCCCFNHYTLFSVDEPDAHTKLIIWHKMHSSSSFLFFLIRSPYMTHTPLLKPIN